MRRSLWRYPAGLALLSQIAAIVLIALAIYASAHFSDWRPTWLAAALCQGLLAMLFARVLGLSRWWALLNLLFVPALLLTQGAQLPSWLFLLGFSLVLLLNWNSFTERVPLYLTGNDASQQLQRVLDQLPPNFRFADLGCGLGGLLLRLARAYPQAHFVGVETAPMPFAVAWLRALGQPNCEIKYRSLWRTSLSQFDAVYCFLSPAPMPAIWRKCCAEMPAGSLLISNSFAVPDQPPEQTLVLHNWRDACLMLWRMPGGDCL